MIMETASIQGIVHGKSVELLCDPGLEEGQRVEVVLRPMPRPMPSEERPICSAAGMLAGIPGLEKSLDEIQQDRKLAPHRTDLL